MTWRLPDEINKSPDYHTRFRRNFHQDMSGTDADKVLAFVDEVVGSIKTAAWWKGYEEGCGLERAALIEKVESFLTDLKSGV